MIHAGPNAHQIEGLRAAHRNAVALADHPEASPEQRADALVLAAQAARELARWDR